MSNGRLGSATKQEINCQVSVKQKYITICKKPSLVNTNWPAQTKPYSQKLGSYLDSSIGSPTVGLKGSQTALKMDVNSVEVMGLYMAETKVGLRAVQISLQMDVSSVEVMAMKMAGSTVALSVLQTVVQIALWMDANSVEAMDL